MTYFNYVIVELKDLPAIVCAGVEVDEEHDVVVCFNPDIDDRRFNEYHVLTRYVNRIIRYNVAFDKSVTEEVVFEP